ncbi:MAG: hypothetical protein KatS3mg059_0581 [Thermomicrobiales bacterium]|nr:MAG: hypothetical protein KatS3mg059_0581 [Thermomicrobiales bacterium]
MRLGRLAAQLGGIAGIVGLLVAGGAAVQAQEASPTAAMGQVATGHPAHIHSGTCDNLGEVVYPLNNIGEIGGMMAGMEASPMAGEHAGAANAIPVEMSVTQLDVSLDDLLAAPYAINVHESQENIGNYIACGNVGGTRVGDTLTFGLGELNNSGYAGVAILSGGMDGQTQVTVYLIQTGGAANTSTGVEATPAS